MRGNKLEDFLIDYCEANTILTIMDKNNDVLFCCKKASDIMFSRDYDIFNQNGIDFLTMDVKKISCGCRDDIVISLYDKFFTD